MNHGLVEVFASECIQVACRFQAFGEMGRLKFGISGLTHVVFLKLAIGTHGAAEQSTAKSAISECGDAVAESVRKNVALDFAFEEIVRRLNCVERRNSLESCHLFRGIIADANGADLALFEQFAKSGGGLFDRDARIRPVHLINIDVVSLQAAEWIVEFLENALARGVAFDSDIRP